MRIYICKYLFIIASASVTVFLLFPVIAVPAEESTNTHKQIFIAPREYANYTGEADKKRMETLLDDSTVTARIKAELFRDASIRDLKISVETHKGQVILSGFVESSEQLHRAAQIASGVRGVVIIKNGLLIKS